MIEDNFMDKFTLQHVVLYSKSWYSRNDIWDDMRACLSADGYSGGIMSNKDIRSVILGQFERLTNTNTNRLTVFVDEIQESNCHRYGYFTKNNSSLGSHNNIEYDLDEAIVRYCLSCFRYMENNCWEICEPDFNNVLPICKDVKEETYNKIFTPIRRKKNLDELLCQKD